MKSIYTYLFSAIVLIALGGCSTTQYGVSESSKLDAAGPTERKVILGMGSANIAALLGSPNIVAGLENEEKAWTYEGIASDVSYARSGNAIVGVIFDPHFDNSISHKTVSDLQPTLTVVIRFNRHDRVRDFSYFASN
jgi:hypothetical protein